MLRSRRATLAAAITALVLSAPDAQAANRGGHRGVGPTLHRQAGVAVRSPDVRRIARRVFDRTAPEGRFDRNAGYRRRLGGGSWPAYGVPSQRPAAASYQRETDAAIDRHVLADPAVVVGIAQGPRPTPTLYIIAGPRDRPVTRSLRLDEAEPRGRPRTRFVHAETGALLLSVPQR